MPERLAPGEHFREVVWQDRRRDYRLHVPRAGGPPWPVVLAFHGVGSNAEEMVAFCGLSEKAEQSGFLAVYPNGTGRTERWRSWNAGNCCSYARRQGVDDVGFAAALLDDLAALISIDPGRIFATGMSNGAMIAYRLASEMADRIAAIAPVAGPMGSEDCHPARPVSVIHFHGSADEFAPFGGGLGPKSFTGTRFYSVEQSLRAWIRANGCPSTPVIGEEPDRADDGTTVTRYVYGPGREGAEVVLLKIDGGGHTWPGREPLYAFLGPSTRDISANDLMWEFFQRHSRR